MIVKSCKAKAVTSPLSILTIMSLRTFSSAYTVERCFLLADCNGSDTLIIFFEFVDDRLLPFLRFG